MSEEKEKSSLKTPLQYASPGGFRWRLCHERWRDAVLRLDRFWAGDGGIEGVEVIEKNPRREIVRLHSVDGSEPLSAVAKAYPITGLRRRLFRYRRYGPMEHDNLVAAKAAGLPVPDVYGLGIQRKFALVCNTVVLMEDLAPRKSLGEILAEAGGRHDITKSCLDAGTTVLMQLYRAGCHNIEVGRDEIFVDRNFDSPPRVLDFRYVVFLDHPSPHSLACMAARLSNNLAPYIAKEILDRWAESLAKLAGIENCHEWMKLFEQLCVSNLSRSERLAMH